MKANQGDFARMSGRIEAIEKWRTTAEAELRDVKVVAQVMAKMKTWAITAFAAFFVGGFLLVAGVVIWMKAPAGLLPTLQSSPPLTAPDPTPSSPNQKPPKTRGILSS
jgi:hypothetical protein